MPRGRKRVRVRRAGLALMIGLAPLALGLSLDPGEAAGQSAARPDSSAPKARAAAEGGVVHDPDNVTGPSQVVEVCARGNERYVARDFAGAVDLYKKAIQLDPRNPLGHYLLGEGHLAMNNLPEAEAAFLAAAERNDARTSPLVRSHVLFAVADGYERQKKWEPARAAWQAYTEHAAKVGADAGAYPQSGVSRLKAIDDVVKLEKQYELVRQRIAAERADAAAPAPKK